MLPPELLQIAKEMGIDFLPATSPRTKYEPLNKLRRSRDKKKLSRRRMVKASRRKNRTVNH